MLLLLRGAYPEQHEDDYGRVTKQRHLRKATCRGRRWQREIYQQVSSQRARFPACDVDPRGKGARCDR